MRRQHRRLLGIGSVACVAGVTAVYWVRRRWVVVTVRGVSMLPVLTDGDTVLARRCTGHNVAVGDIIVFEPPGEDGDGGILRPGEGPGPGWFVKRVAGVAGGRLPAGLLAEDPAPDVIRRDALSVLGDNGGYDSRVFGALPCDRVLGVVSRRLAVTRRAVCSSRCSSSEVRSD